MTQINIPQNADNENKVLKVEVEEEELIEINYHKWEKQAQNLKLIQEQTKGSTQYDTEGLDQNEIDAAVAEEKFIKSQNGNYDDSKIIKIDYK